MTLTRPQRDSSTDARSRRAPYRVIIWGPGTYGGAVLEAALRSNDFEVVGVRAFSPQKVGTDIGTLVGMDPVGITAKGADEEIMALDADVVVYTPDPKVVFSGLYQHVDAFLRSGKNVVSTCSHFNITYQHPLTEAAAPSVLLAMITGISRRHRFVVERLGVDVDTHPPRCHVRSDSRRASPRPHGLTIPYAWLHRTW